MDRVPGPYPAPMSWRCDRKRKRQESRQNEHSRTWLLVRKRLSMTTQRILLWALVLLNLTACEAIGLRAKIVSSQSINGKTKTTVREAKNWDEFEEAMGEVATDFSSFAKEVGSTTAELATKLVDVPPQGEVKLGQLASSLKPFEGDIRYDYIKVAKANPNAEYNFRYVQIGMPEYDNFFRASAEMYAVAYQLMETGRHVYLASYQTKGEDAPSEVEDGSKKVKRDEVDALSSQLGDNDGARKLQVLWGTTAELGVKLAAKSAETVKTGAALLASAPSQIMNPKLVLHLDLIVKGLSQSVNLVKDTATMLGEIVG
jgi:hypothetical protein